MFDQRCPHCGVRLGVKTLAILDARHPTLCPSCKELLFNTWRSELLGLLTLIITVVAATLPLMAVVKENFLLVILPLAMAGPFVGALASAVWAAPRIIHFKPRLCAVCHRQDAGYAKPGDRICADCTERLEFERVMAEQRALESQPGYHRSPAIDKEIARLRKRDRGRPRPNGEL